MSLSVRAGQDEVSRLSLRCPWACLTDTPSPWALNPFSKVTGLTCAEGLVD